MKRIFWMIAAFSFISIGAEAQQERKTRERMTPERVAEKATERMTQDLDLTEEQKNAVHALHLESATKKAEEMKAQWEKMKAEQKAQQEKLDAILSPQQKAQWEAKKSETREKRIQHNGKRGQDWKKKDRNRNRG